MAIRPYLQKSIIELEALFKAQPNPEQMKKLKQELEHRKTHRAVKLLELVIEKLRDHQSSSERPTKTTIPQASTRKSTPRFAPTQQKRLGEDNPPPLGAQSTHTWQTHGQELELSGSSHSSIKNGQVRPGTRGVMRPPGNITGVPKPRTFELDKTLKLDVPKGATSIQLYEAALKELIKEMKRDGAAVRQILLRDGKSLNLDSQEYGYQFRYDDEADLFEGAAITASVNGHKIDGKIVAVTGQTLLVSLTADFGPHIDTCLLRVDNTAMLEVLRARLEKIGQGSATGFNLRMADAVVANAGDMVTPEHPPSSANELNRLQQEAVAGMMANEIYYLWGPPGTGKTETLSALAVALMEQKKRLLVCSNTNQAVDQILLKLCKRFTAKDPLVSDGGIIRIGTIVQNELLADWSEKITIDGIVERRSTDLLNRKDILQPMLDNLNTAAARATETVDAFERLDKLQAEVRKKAELCDSANRALMQAEAAQQVLGKRQQELDTERAAVIEAGTLRRLMMRSLEKIDRDIAKLRSEFIKAEGRVPALREQAQLACEQANSATEAASTMQRSLSILNRAAAEKELEEFDGKRRPILDEIADINKQLDDIRKTVLDRARIIGATVTKAYLNSQMFSSFDVVVIDEASMVMLPALFHAAGMATEKVIISGDSKQLAPIVQTNQQAIYDVIGKSVFTTAKIGLGKKLKRTTLLEEQYRMDDRICKLITGMYNGKLRTGVQNSPEKDKGLPIPAPFNSPLTIIDTSAVAPFVNRDAFNSRYNLMNALAVRNLCRHLSVNGCLTASTDLGVATPYSAQSKLLKQALAEFGDNLQAGTVHRYQGDEKTAMILDIPDSLGEHRAGYFLEATFPDHPGALLFNVGISRAKKHLIVCANISYLDSKLPGDGNLRDILYNMQRQGTVVDVRDVLALYPVIDDLRKFGKAFNLSEEAEQNGLFNEEEFNQVILADLERAQHSVAIFSGFITTQRVASYESIFRSKLAAGVKIRCVTRPPRKNGSINPGDGKVALDALEEMGCVVDTRGDIHEKAVLIDEEVLWFGSLNPLSYSMNTSEVMVRSESKMMTLAFAALMALERGVKAEKMKGATTKAENPRCEECGSRTAWMKGKYGPYWECESENCNWELNHGAAKRRTSQKQSTEPSGEERICEKCGMPLKLKSGRFGNFYGCTGYPDCKYHEKP